MSLSSFALGWPLAVLATSAALAQQPDSLAKAPTPAAPPATMFKLGLDVPRLWLGYWGAGVPLYGGMERQLGQHWSFTADLNVGLGTSFRRGGFALQQFGAALGTRYYYSQARRLRKGKPVRALGGTYLQLQAASEFEGYFGYDIYPYNQLYYRHTPKLELLWGYQRRLGRYGFMDVGAGISTSRQNRYSYSPNGDTWRRVWTVEPTLRARIGLAF
jgi:hypothetical protein